MESVAHNFLNVFHQKRLQMQSKTRTTTAKHKKKTLTNMKDVPDLRQIQDIAIYNRLLSAWARKGLDVKELFNKCVFYRDEQQFVLKVIEKNPYTGVLPTSEFHRLVQTQMEREIRGSVTVKSILKQSAPGKRALDYRKKLESVLDYNLTLYPYLKVLEPQEYAQCLLQEIETLASSSETFSPSKFFLWRQLSGRIHQKFIMMEKIRNKVPKKMSQLYKEYLDKYNDPDLDLDSHRQQWQGIVVQSPEGPSLAHPVVMQLYRGAEISELTFDTGLLPMLVLDVIIELFNNKGNASLDIPPPASECPSPPKITPQMTPYEKAQAQKQRQKLSQQRAEMYSLWCTELYRLSIANQYRDEVLWFPHNMDFRGRTYPTPPHFNHLGSDVTRSILKFAKGKPLGPKGLDWMKIHLVNLTGFKKRCSNAERLAYANKMMPKILDSADNPLTVEKERQKDAAAGVEIAKVLEGYVRRKVIKQTVMTTVYGVTRYGAKAQILRQLKDIPEFPHAQAWAGSRYLTEKTFHCLNEMFSATKDIQICRQQFVALHKQPILEDLSNQLVSTYTPITDSSDSEDDARIKLRNVLASVPARGDFDLDKVLESTYFFS
nr:hypothetical protein BaRGS_005192 [Batillaria attramentaria]